MSESDMGNPLRQPFNEGTTVSMRERPDRVSIREQWNVARDTVTLVVSFVEGNARYGVGWEIPAETYSKTVVNHTRQAEVDALTRLYTDQTMMLNNALVELDTLKTKLATLGAA